MRNKIKLSGLKGLGAATLLSGGVVNHGGIEGYISDSARRTLGLKPSVFQDGQVHYYAKDCQILKRAFTQTTHQMAYGMLRSYPRFLKYWEQKKRDEYLTEKSQTSLANEGGQYFQLISQQRKVDENKKKQDTIVGNMVYDYLELSIDKQGKYFDNKTGKIEDNEHYGLVEFVDLQPVIQISSKNNIILTTVQGRDYTRKELVSGGDYQISISGMITSKYPDVYPEIEVSKFLKLMQYRGIIHCSNTILQQFNIKQLIVLSFNFPSPSYRNIQPYKLECVAVEPSEAIEIKSGIVEAIDESMAEKEKWIKILKYSADAVDPTSILKISQLWL